MKSKILAAVVGLLLLNLNLGCFAPRKPQQSASDASSPNDISIMAYNVENLFDTIHDKGTEDYSYQPLTKKNTIKHKRHCETIRSRRYKKECLELDWSTPILNRKMHRLATTILQVNNNKGPDILIMPEVENIRILKLFNKKYLKAAEYKTIVHLEGPDKRGIDVSILTRLPQASKPILHKIPFQARDAGDQEWMSRSRGILQSHFTLPDGQEIAIFGVHFPSPRNPTYWRQQGIAFLNHLKSQLPKNVLAVAAGDFNITQKEEKSHRLYSQQIGKEWLVSHKIGCPNCKGTNYYHSMTSWSFLDAILFDKKFSELSHWYVDRKSISIPNQSIYQVNKWGSPAHFNSGNYPIGVSDHWPIYAVLKNRKQQKTVNTIKNQK